MNSDQVKGYPGPQAGYAGRVSALRFYLAIMRRRWMPITLMILVGAALGVAYQLHKTVTYTAHAQVQVNRQSLTSLLTNTADPTASSASNFASVVQTQAAVARSPQVAERVVAAVPRAHLTYQQFLTNSQVTPSVNSDVIDMYVTDPHGDVAKDLVNAYARAFVQFRITLDTAALKTASAELGQRISSLQATGLRADQRLAGALAAKQQQLQEFEALQTSNVVVTTQAPNATKVAPSAVKNVALGVIAGIVLALILTAALEALDTRVRTPEELEQRLGLPTLGVIPPPPSELKGSLVMIERPTAPEAEAFRVLRLSLDMASPDLDVKTVLFTSALAGEGKSTTIANLGVSMARGGLRVVLVDLDLRRPTLHNMFKTPRSPGVTGVVLGRSSLDDALRPVDVGPVRSRRDTDSSSGQLQLLTAGPSPPDPGEFVTAGAITRLLDALGSDADIVLVDAPPTLVSDPYGISAAVDGVVLVARLPMLKRGAVEHLQHTLGTFDAPVLGIVRTGKLARESDYYGGYGYGYGDVSGADNQDVGHSVAPTPDPEESHAFFAGTPIPPDGHSASQA